MNVKGVLLGGVAALLWVASAIAQPAPLSQNTITSATPLQQGQIQEVRNYVTHHVRLLVGTDLTAAASARRQLFVPLGGSGNESGAAFLQVYGSEIAAAVRGVSADNALAEKPVARMNAMLVLARVPSNAAVDLQLAALVDPLDAVRYWACKGLRVWAEGNPGNQDLIDRVTAAMRITTLTEGNADVLTQQIHTLVNLGTRTSGSTAMAALDSRLAKHQSDATLSLMPVIEGISAQSKVLIRKDVQTPGSVRTEFIDLARVSVKYYDFASRVIASRDYDTRRNDVILLLRASDAALRSAFPAGVDHGVPADLLSLINTPSNWGTLRERATQWNLAVTTRLTPPASN